MSIAVGMFAAVAVGLVGPLWGGLVVVLARPVIFLTVSRALLGSETAPEWDVLLLTAGVAWLVFLPFAPAVHWEGVLTSDDWRWLLAIGAIPLLGAGLAHWRRRSTASLRGIRQP